MALSMQPKENPDDGNKPYACFSVDTERPFPGADDGVFEYLELFEQLGIKSTFFVVGSLGEKRPDIVDAIHAAGHEIACHAWDHPNIGEPPSERAPFVDELDENTLDTHFRRCHETLARDGNPLRGFRAPWFRISDASLSVIGDHFDYDSSLTIRTNTRIAVPPNLTELPVSTLGYRGPRIGASFLFGPGAMRVARTAVQQSRPRTPLIMFGHSFDLSGCPRDLYTAAWKRAWYFNRCGRQRIGDLAGFLSSLRDSGYRFVRCGDLVSDAP
jgi:peptidoglycan/xylan/chitin deacetylase (PgdA/CDA1 family)